MNGPLPDPAHRSVLGLFPPALRALVEAELRAGNRIIASGASHPAPPAGAMIKLERDLLTWDATVHEGLRLYARDSSMHHQEITDAAAFFWVLTAPLPPPPEPDMDAIREAAGRPSMPLAPPAPTVYPPGSVEMDPRGEMLILHEEGRHADIIWTWSRGNLLYRSSLSAWWYPAERRSQAMTGTEKEAVLQRFMDFGRAHIGSDIQLID